MAQFYRLSRPLVATYFGSAEPITLPAGAEIERDDFMQAAGLADVWLNGKRITIMVKELGNLATLVEKAD